MSRPTPKPPAAKPARPTKAAASPKAAKPEKPVKPKAEAKPARPEKPARAQPAGRIGGPTGGLKLRDLVTQVATATGTKKPDAKTAVEATLAALATALKAGAEVTVPPLGKLRVVKTAEKGGATMMTLKLRHTNGADANAADADDAEKPPRKAAAKPLAEDDKDD